ncbi:MAG: hypothetical protein ABIR18_05275 [Chitinophagaceae bacterium]
MKHAFLTGLLLITLSSFAQNCDEAVLQKKPGIWKAAAKGSIQNVTSADLVKERAVLAGIHKMITAHYNPVGCQVEYSNVFGKQVVANQRWIADPYHYVIWILRYLCDKGSADKTKSYVDISTPTTVNITANVMYWLDNLYAAELEPDDFRGYLKLTKRPEKKDGYYFMGEEVVGDGHLENKIKEYRWLITYNDTLPFSYISRKEYLFIQKKRLEKDIKESPSEQSYLGKYLTNISDYLKKPETELSKPAICMWNEEQRFEKFVEEGTRGSFIAIKPNTGYYHKKLPKSSPQFFTVVYKISHGNPVFEENIANIKKAVDFAALRNMLGK